MFTPHLGSNNVRDALQEQLVGIVCVLSAIIRNDAGASRRALAFLLDTTTANRKCDQLLA